MRICTKLPTVPTLCIVGILYWNMISLRYKHHLLTFTKRNTKRVWNLSSRKSLHIFSIKVRILNAVIWMRIYSTVITRNIALNAMYSFSSRYHYPVHLHIKVGITPPQSLRRYIYSESVRPTELMLTDIRYVWTVTERSSNAGVRVRISQPFWPKKQPAIQAQTITGSEYRRTRRGGKALVCQTFVGTFFCKTEPEGLIFWNLLCKATLNLGPKFNLCILTHNRTRKTSINCF